MPQSVLPAAPERLMRGESRRIAMHALQPEPAEAL
jgi:hypothetical protein